MKKPSSVSLSFWMVLFTLLGLPSCNKGNDQVAAADAAEAKSSIEKTNAGLENELKLLKRDFEKSQAATVHKNEELERSNDALKSQFEKAQDDAARVRGELTDYMAKYKASQRAKAQGLSVPRFESSDHVIFENVVVKELTPKEVAFTHSGGISRLPLLKLAPDLQRKFLYDPEEVKSIDAAEAAGAEAVKGLTNVAGVTRRDPSRPVNAIAVHNLTNRVVAREAEIARSEKEAIEVRKSSYGATNIAKYRLQQLDQRVARLKQDIVELRQLLDKELNGPQTTGSISGIGNATPPAGSAER